MRLERAAAQRPRGKHTTTSTGAARSDLAPQRARLKRLNDRLYELGQRYDDDDEDGSEDSGGEDILAKYCSRPAPSPKPLPTPQSALGETQPVSPVVAEGRGLPGTVTASSGVRSRFPGHASSPLHPSASTTSSSLFAPPTTASPSTTSPTTATALDAQASTQNDLTASLLSMASALKDSAQAFGADLAADAAALSATEGALGKSKDGLDAATRRMGVLARMSEGRWWWGRMVLYAAIAGLWVVALLVVFVGPKLRL